MQKHTRIVIGFLLALITIFGGASPALAQTTEPLKKVSWHGKDWFLHGVNMPWVQWGCDFGSGCSWGDNGVESTTVQAKIRPEFQKLKDNKLHVVRWWMFPGTPTVSNGNRMILTDSSGKPTGIDPGVYRDIDAALQLAQEYDLYYNFTLFSSPSSLPASWRDNETHRQALADVLGQMFARYKDNPRIMAWETFNEPEWEIFWDNQTDMRNKTVDLVKRIIAVQRNTTPALVNIGPAWVQLDVWTNANVDVDFYSPHYYDNMTNQWGRRDNAFSVTASQLRQEYGIDKPILLGEIYVGSDVNPAERYQKARDLGYAGAWGWSLFYNSTSDKMQIDMAGAKSFADKHTDIGPTSSGTTSPTATPAPTTTRTPTPVQKSTVAVYAKGFAANNTYPTMQVYINNTLVKTFTNVQDALTTPLTFEFNRKIVSSDVLKVAFTNDYYTSRTNDRNLLIDKIQVDTKTYQTEASTVYGTGVATSAGCKSGYLKQQQLNCNGYFQYNLQ